MQRTSLPLALLSMAFVSSAFGQDAQTTAVNSPRTDEAYHVEFVADAWFARLLGDITTPNGAVRDIKTFDLRDSEVAFAGGAQIDWDRCFARVGATAFDTDGDYTAGGDTFASEFTWWSFSADVGYALFTPFADQATPWGDAAFDRYGGNVNSEGDYVLDLRISPTLGLSYHDLDFSENNLTQATSIATDGSWIAARGGVEFEVWLRPGADFSFLKAVVIEAGLSAGPVVGVTGDADGMGLAVQLEAGVRLMFHENIGARLGYRFSDADFDASDTASDFDVGAYGLFAGITLRF